MIREVSQVLMPSLPPFLRWIAVPVLSVSPVIVLIIITIFFFLLPMRQEIAVLEGRLAAESRYQRTLSQEMTEFAHLQAAKAELKETLDDYRQQVPLPERLPFIHSDIEQLASDFGRVTHWVASTESGESPTAVLSLQFRLVGEDSSLWEFLKAIQASYPTLSVSELVWSSQSGTAAIESSVNIYALNPYEDGIN